MVDEHEELLRLIDRLVLGAFMVEAALKILARGTQPWQYFQDGWNVFDFSIIVASFLPISGQHVSMLRLIRLLRILKVIRVLPKLRMLVQSLFKSISSLGYISVLLLLVFYVYVPSGSQPPLRTNDTQYSVL